MPEEDYGSNNGKVKVRVALPEEDYGSNNGKVKVRVASPEDETKGSSNGKA